MYSRIAAITIFIIVLIFLSFDFNAEESVLDNRITVEVRGEVERDGLYELDYGSTFDDLLKEIELNEDADIGSISYQQTLYDGEMIVIGKNEDKPLISINSAGVDQLCLLPGIGEKTAIKIVEYRNEVGYFSNLEELMLVKGIGPAKYEKIREYITL